MKKVIAVALFALANALTMSTVYAKGGGGHGGGHSSGGHSSSHSSAHSTSHVSTPSHGSTASPTGYTGHSWWPFRPWSSGGSGCTDQKKKEGRC